MGIGVGQNLILAKQDVWNFNCHIREFSSVNVHYTVCREAKRFWGAGNSDISPIYGQKVTPVSFTTQYRVSWLFLAQHLWKWRIHLQTGARLNSIDLPICRGIITPPKNTWEENCILNSVIRNIVKLYFASVNFIIWWAFIYTYIPVWDYINKTVYSVIHGQFKGL